MRSIPASGSKVNAWSEPQFEKHDLPMTSSDLGK
jgi:hypothetical protein